MTSRAREWDGTEQNGMINKTSGMRHVLVLVFANPVHEWQTYQSLYQSLTFMYDISLSFSVMVP
jgi:hypothetical protein